MCVGWLVEGYRGRVVPDRQLFLLPGGLGPVGGMYRDHPPIYMMYYVFVSTVTTGCEGLCGCGVCKLAVW